jgi:hypothetical protein
MSELPIATPAAFRGRAPGGAVRPVNMAPLTLRIALCVLLVVGYLATSLHVLDARAKAQIAITCHPFVISDL